MSSLQHHEAVQVFFSYSHSDEHLRDELAKHLGLLKHKGVIDTWHDRNIEAGEDWKHAIDSHLQSAQIILLLVSSDFLHSNYCYELEMKMAMARHAKGEARVIPIILRPVDWHEAPFSQLKSLPNDGKPVTSWENQDEAFRDVAYGLRKVVEQLTPKTSDAPKNKNTDLNKEKPENMALVRESEAVIEITINRDFDTYTDVDQERFLKAVRSFLEMDEGALKITKKRRGSVKIGFSLPDDKADKLRQAIEAGVFDEHDAISGDLVHKLKAKDSTGRWAYYFIYVKSESEQAFLDALESTKSIDLENYGTVIASCYGEEPDESVKNFLKEKYGFVV